ncbi:MAG: SDR family oxidoreductase [Thermoflexales bacterium]|nr:SDR family oxidoreductase [Thermoflexales bacterium]MCS7325384.1 SDR family oxidoreductase [Thermoflexales bacterium]MDW8053006.1 SDR family oxidoreductase [Anaerolineae bacterium]MDW8291659.1 SDR family oxidoreductase [Anaerolineae bacterium]
MNILVTGGAGFIGSHVCDRLIAEGHFVIAMDNFITGSRRNVAHLIGHPRFRLVEQDIIKACWVDEPLDAVMNLASPASPRGYLDNPIETLLVGSHGTYNALELARLKGARFLQASTSEVYGDPLEHPQKESYWGHVNPIGVRSVYDEAKRFAEALTMAYHRKYGLQTRIARIFNTYGPRMSLDDGRVVPNFVRQALNNEPLTVYGDGSATRAFCYVSDLVEGLLRLLWSEEVRPVNLGNPHEITILEFAQAVKWAAGPACTSPILIHAQPSAERIADDPQRRRPDITRAREVLGWEPKVSLEEGLRETFTYFRQALELEKA